MRIFLLNRDETMHLGGDAIQLRAYQTALRKLGHEVEYSGSLTPDVKGYDEAWLFHINMGWTVYQWRQLQQHNIPYRVFAIYYKGVYSDTNHETMKSILNGAKKVYCLSSIEKQELLTEFPEIEEKCVIIDNGVDKSIFNKGKRTEGKYLLSVGRYSGSKRLKEVVKAGKELGIPTKIVGTSWDRDYFSECRNENKSTECLVDLTQQQLADIYRNAKVYVCASESERNNLCVLEAAACGCTIVDSAHNKGKELHKFYVGDFANFNEFKVIIKHAWIFPVDSSAEIKDWSEIVNSILDD